MNEELKRLLDNARAAGANASQLQGIVDAYNLKKKDNPNGTGNAIIGGEIGGIAGASKAQSVEPKVNAINNDEELSISSFKRRGQIPNAVKEAGGNAIVKTPEILFSGADKEGLKKLREKYNVTEFGFNPIEDIRKSEAFKSLIALTSSGDKLANITSSNDVSYRPYIAELTDAKSVEENLIARLGEKKNQLRKNLFKDDAKTINKTKDEISVLENDLRLAKKIRNKAAAELAIEGEDEIEATIRTDESGNLLNKTTNRLMAITSNPEVSISGFIGMSLENSDRIDKLPPQFVTGLNYLKNSEPVIFERVTDALQKGLPISESQIATITQQGIELEQSRLKRKLDKEEITPEYYSAKAVELNTVRKNNLLDNKETLRAFLSDGAANILDEIGRAKNAAADIANPTSSYAFGHTWNYDDKEIKYAAEQYAAKNGLDPQDGRIQKAIKYLQDNEGAMIMENSIAKAGGVRELFKGLAEPIRGISNSIEDLGKSSNDVYVESQSQGNANISEKRLKLEDTGIRGVVNDVVKGTGQFVTQAGLAYLTSSAVGLTGKALLGAADAAAIESGVALTNATKSDIIGKALLGTKDGISTFITSYAQAYDSNLKNALSYTSDNQLAKQAASVNSALEGATELFLSPLDIAKGIGAKFASKGVTEDLLKVLSDKNLMKSPDKLKDFLSKTLKAVSGTAYVAGAEIGEEYVTQIADYVTNATLNPNSQTFQNRDLQNELSVTAYQTGLSMAIPALLNGIGAANANSFSKGSLLVAAQNRQKLIEGLDEDLALNNIDQDEYNEKAQIINTAAVANAELPLKADGTKLSTDEKADYIFSRTSEAVMKDKIEKSKDEAEKRILEGKIKTQQDFRTELLGTPTVVQQVVSDELAADAVITETQQNSTPETVIDIIPALKEKLTNVTVENDAELLNYAIDKVAEAPTKLKTDLGDELFNQVLAQTPTEKLQEGLDFLINNNPDSEDVDVLDKIISERESANTKIAQPKEQQTEEVKPPTSKSERLAAFKNKYVEPTQPTATEQKQWGELSIQEKLALAKENLPQVDNLSNVEAIRVADQNAKMLLGKLNKPKVENENIQEPIQKTDERVTRSNEPITSKESSTTKEGNGENLQSKSSGKEKVEAGGVGVEQNKIDNEKIKENEIIIADDKAENDAAVAKLTEQDNIEQEPNVKAIERQAENANRIGSKEIASEIDKIDNLINAAIEVVNVPIAEIKTNETEYQGRKNKFSERSANNVAKNFDKNKLQPITVYKHPDGNTYVLSGHSRLEGMKRRNATTIPATYFEGTPQEAKDFSLKSNKLGTLQTDIENAAYYRKKLLEGESYNAVLKEAKENEQEGSAKRIVSLAHLNPNGKAMQDLEALDKGEGDSKTNILNIATKIGDIRAKNDHITNAHENELYDFMVADKKNIPTDKDLTNASNTLNRSINNAKFTPEEPLNLDRVVNKSENRIQWEKELRELEAQQNELKLAVNPSKKTGWTGLKEKAIASLAKGDKSKEGIDKAVTSFENNDNGIKDAYQKQLETKRAELSAVNDKLAKHLLREKDLIEGDKAQQSLFSIQSPTTDEISDMKDIVKDYVDEGTASLQDIQNDVAKELGDNSQEMRDLVEKAYNEFYKTKESTPIEVTSGVIGKVGKFLSRLFGGTAASKVFIAKDEKALIQKYDSVVKNGDSVSFQMTMPNGSKQTVKRIDVDVVNGFYSPLEKVITDSKFDKLPAKQWAEKYANSEEAKWTGLKEWLAQQQGSVSKADIQQFLKDNRIQVVEVVKGGEGEVFDYDNAPKEVKKAIDEIGLDDVDALIEELEPKGYVISVGMDGEIESINKGGEPTKFSQYQLEGQRENYKEVLVTLPSKTVSEFSIKERQSPRGTGVIYDIVSNKTGFRVSTHRDATEAMDNLKQYNKNIVEDKRMNFKSSHFDEPNILVHLRMNTRTDAEGNKVLFLEEVQSDFAQLARKKGFKSGNINELKTELAEAEKEYEKLDFKNLKLSEIWQTKEAQRVESLKEKISQEENGLPQAPFVTDTNAWTKLGLKVALKEAVKQGADKIAWTTGEQQNDRYDLSKQVDEITYRKNDDGNYFVSATKNGSKVFSETNVAENKLESFFGKDVAQRIINSEGDKGQANSKILKGEQLSVGGKGMKGFYGSPAEGSLGIVGNVAKSLFKQEPKTISIETAKNNEYTLGEANYVDGIGVYDGKGDMVAEFDTKAEANKFILEKSNQTQHSIDVTPELKAQVEEGLPMFMKNKQGDILGFAHEGKIYLNGENINPNSPIHEAGHIWTEWAKLNNTEVYNRGMQLTENSKYLKEVKANEFYKSEASKLGSETSEEYNDYMKHEALAMAIGDKGAQFVGETRKKDFKEWLNNLWDKIKAAAGFKDITAAELQNLTFDEFTKRAAADILRDEEIAQPQEQQQQQGTDKEQAAPQPKIKSKLTDIELGVIRNVLESTIDARQYPTFFDMNQPLVQQTAKTQGEGQDRIPLDGSYIQAHLADLRSISLNNARVLRDALGNDWKEKMINFFEENPKAGDIAVVSGILNVINTDINNEIAASKNGTEISKLKDLQARADRITYDTARSASLALNQRRLYQDFGQGKNVADIISSIILTPEQQDIKRKVEEALKQKFTDEELNKPKPPKPKKPKAAPKPKASNPKNDDSVKNDLISKGQKAAQQTDADGNVTIVSLKDKIQQANDALNGFKC